MQRKLFPVAGILAGAVLTVALAVLPAAAQRPLPPTSVSQVHEVLQQGQQLESGRRWSEALSFYEEAVRKFPDDAAVRDRFDLARMHYDLGRRYNDGSFRDLVVRLSSQEALDVYGEVLLKIQSHYVESPDWKEIVARGTKGFDVALSEPAFIVANLSGVDARTVAAFRAELHRRIESRPIDSPSAARSTVGMAAELAAQRLALAPAAVAFEYLCGATNSLDLYSAYLTPNQLGELYSQIEGNFVGLGIELKAADGGLLIVRVISGSPAQSAGILAGDRILNVDGTDTTTLSTEQAARLLEGTAGSIARLVIETPGHAPRTLAVGRNRIEVPSIDDVKIVDTAQGIGYLKLTCFQKTTARDLDHALWSLHRRGMRSLVMDLRGNPGGLLLTAVEVADRFIAHGVIVSTHGRSAGEDFTYSAHREGTWQMPLVVLIDEDSASAAEIFAGAIRDLGRGKIVGHRSFGKGSVQGIFPLNTSTAGVRLTTAKFYSPLGIPYAGRGVEPDVPVQHVARPVFVSDGNAASDVGQDDAWLNTALDAARKQLVAQR